MLNPDQLKARDGKLTASRVACLMTGSEADILALWQEMVGDPAFVPQDLSGVWPVQLGSCTEDLNLSWYERKHNPVSRRGEVVVHPQFDWAACTLDGWSDEWQAPIECKHVGGREELSVILDRYQPQAHWIMTVTGARQCIFSIIEGAREPIIEHVIWDDAYAAELMTRAQAFWLCVQTLTPPCAVPPVAAPVRAENVYDFSTSNQWCSEAITWLTNKTAAKDFAGAEKALKALIPADAARVFGAGLECKRDRAGRLSLRGEK